MSADMNGFKVGDRVEMVNPHWKRSDSENQGTVGTISDYDTDALFRIQYDNGHWTWAAGYEVRHLAEPPQPWTWAAGYEVRHLAEPPQPDPVLVAAKALLTFLESNGRQDIPTGYRPATRIDPEEPIYLDLSCHDLVAFPGKELARLQEALSEAIEGGSKDE
jgi:hypothetical protein